MAKKPKSLTVDDYSSDELVRVLIDRYEEQLEHCRAQQVGIGTKVNIINEISDALCALGDL